MQVFSSVRGLAGAGLMALGLAAAAPAAALTVYSAGPAPLIEALAAGFTKLSGEPVSVFQGTTGKIFARLEAEAANPQADVVISASWDSAVDLDQRGWLMPYASPKAASVPDVYKTSNYVAQGLSALALVWNTKSGTPRPGDWNDLTADAFRDKVNLPDPAQSGTALELLAGLVSAQGDKAWQLMSELRGNGAAVAGANAAALNPVLQGAKAAVFGAVDYVAYGQKAKGEAIEVIFPSSGTVIAPRPMMILKSTSQPEQAKAFIDYVLSSAGQTEVAKVYLIPATTGVPAQRVGLADIPLLQPSRAVDGGTPPATDRATLLREFDQAFGR
ncbi:MAG: extracellular solute-binding protein [Pigmentiphaga sp.]|nr:extracellular solute-binding protein [Pigmentiphaga sp.]